jgi:hypothetical protein
MIQITKGTPTAEEMAALVAVLALLSTGTQSAPIGSTAAGWQRSAPIAQLDRELGGRDRCWRPWFTGWSRVGSAHTPTSHQIDSAATRSVS